MLCPIPRPSLRILSRSRSHKQCNSRDLPNELWANIFVVLETPALVAVSRVNRAFNALALPIYLARYHISQAALYAGNLTLPINRPEVLPVLQTAFSLPPIRNLTCRTNRGHLVRFLRSFIAQHSTLEEIHLTFYADLFRGQVPPHIQISPSTARKEVCRLLNGIKRAGRALIIVGNTALLSGSEIGDLWRVARVRQAPPAPGIRAKIRKAAVAVRDFKGRSPRAMALLLHTACKFQGVLCRDSHILDRLRSVDVVYSRSPGQWTVITLNSSVVDRFSLTPALSASDWAYVLPLLSFRFLAQFTMGRPTVFGDSELRDISTTDLDAFLMRHPTMTYLEYVPQLPAPPSDLPPDFSLPRLTHLTTTPVHFVHLHKAPNTFPELTELILFAPTSMPASSAQEGFMAVLHLLAEWRRSTEQNLCLRFPGVWIVHVSSAAGIECVGDMLMYGDFELDVPAIAEFLSPFEAGMKRVELHPTHGTMFERKRCVDELRRKVPWLVDVSCSRVDSDTQTVFPPQKRKRVSTSYSD
ncbi:hypothetical protein DFH09DRAFT_1286008 [Mycena vulgaris]|nr:hypothetical protein DFH09DRAFT_1286008 [Mycena vulgaris]